MTRRRLRPDEIELWRKVVEKAERLHADPEPEDPGSPPPSARARSAAQTRVTPFRIGAARPPAPEAHHLKPSLSERFVASSVQMDRKTYVRMARGRIVPEARLDLHGMTLDRAHPALSRFILSAQSSGKRLVLVITGKGKRQHDDGPIPVPRGVLRHQVPQWLSAPPLSQAVLQITPAHVSHGGEGAYYVYLRRPRA